MKKIDILKGQLFFLKQLAYGQVRSNITLKNVELKTYVVELDLELDQVFTRMTDSIVQSACIRFEKDRLGTATPLVCYLDKQSEERYIFTLKFFDDSFVLPILVRNQEGGVPLIHLYQVLWARLERLAERRKDFR
jgi:hypothetical protein